MATINLIPVFLTGLVGSLHCIGMCGGIVSAFSVSASPLNGRPFPVPVVAAANSRMATHNAQPILQHAARALSYNAGRISSYMLAGALAGGVGSGALLLAGLAPLQQFFYWAANLMLLAIGFYLMGVWRGLPALEAAGQFAWRRISPLTARLLPLDSNAKTLAMGALWGWLPCGMVYSSLLTAMLSGSARSGALVMLAFGAGTLPLLLAMGTLGAGARKKMQKPAFRLAAGLLIAAFGLLGLIRAAYGSQASWLDNFCITPHLAPSSIQMERP
ncbi:sulfite exporter TauE/SafE family protein [Undibacterium terreum]|uniref:Cytochrome biogenesis protein n=1 Tax=Undibacterium terreum TaxID=1224302 RepID=A0A916UEI1_9BURK|nr:sulfite exporter TauE/SafE family protein [Undibacterium terreum]GGC70058.1 cytochrome biogenesis protein [Undibacterium terreum]